MNNKSLRIFLLVTVILLMTAVSVDLVAQCPMCRMSAESNLAHGGTEGKGLNKGILYLFSMPYLLVGGLAFLWWKNKKSETEIFEQEAS